MSTATLLVGDVFERLAEIPDGSVDLVLTSPPFLALRSYLPPDHPDKAKEIGSEPTPAAFLDTLLRLTAEWRRVLAPHGSIAVELGDTYSGSGGAGGDYAAGGMREGQPTYRQGTDGRMHPDRRSHGAKRRDGGSNGRRSRSADEADGILTPRCRPGPEGRDRMAGWPLDKSLCGIPHLYHLSLAYGRNLLTGEPSPAGPWRVRNVVAWCRPNPPVGALGDKFRPATSYMTVATVARDRYFDLDAVRTQHTVDPHGTRRVGEALASKGISGGDSGNADKERLLGNPAGAPPLDWWEIPTQPYKGSHYATWPMALCERPIKAMCPLKVCTECGEPSRRITETEQVPTRSTNGRKEYPERGSMCENFDQRTEAHVQTVGWTDCGHDAWRNGVVLDPFAGSGTTLAAATGHGRDAIGIDLDHRNADLARDRVGMFLTVEYPTTEGAA